MSNITKVGIVGRGEFAKLIAHHAPSSADIVYFGRKSDYAEITECQVLFLCVPVQSYRDVLKKLKEKLNPETLVVDVCSVKLVSQKLIKETLPSHQNILVSHPMFGPQTATASLEGHQFVVCAEEGNARWFVDLLERTYKLNVIRMSADEHDRTMADVHGLTLFLARGVGAHGYNVSMQRIHAPSFDWVLGLAELDVHHSDALMETIESYNPYAAESRARLLKNLIDFDKKYTATEN